MSNDDTISAGPGSNAFDEADTSDLSAETLEAIAEARRRIAETPASVVIANHAMGLFELAAIHLSDVPPRLGDAQLAIDALGFVVEGLGERIGEHHDTLVSALANIRLVFVERSKQTQSPSE